MTLASLGPGELWERFMTNRVLRIVTRHHYREVRGMTMRALLPCGSATPISANSKRTAS